MKREEKIKNNLIKIMLVIIAVLIFDRLYEYKAEQLIAEAHEEIIPIYRINQKVVYGEDTVELTDLSNFKYEKTVYDFVPLDCELSDDLQEYAWMLCESNNVSFSLLMAIMKQESGYNPHLISNTNDYGLMQINKINHEWLAEALGITDFLDPKQNIKAGVYILKLLFEKYDDTKKVLMAYNMGEGNAKKYWEGGIFETEYCEKVLINLSEYQQQESMR